MKLRGVPLDGSQPELFQPASGWRPYQGPLPRLRGVSLGIDTETKDDGLAKDMGPGWVYDMGHLCGVSVAWGNSKIYVPVRHPDTDCRSREEVVRWVDDLLRENECYFFNLGYDMGWLMHEGVSVWPERAHDAYLMSVMLDENQLSYDLDDCCARAGIVGKDRELLRDAAVAYGVDPRSGMWRMPARYVGPYAEQDAVSTLHLGQLLIQEIDEQRMRGAYQTEIDLVPCLYDMRKRGIPVSEENAARSQAHVREQRQLRLAEIGRQVGRRVTMPELLSSAHCGRILTDLGVKVPRTKPSKNHPEGQPSIQKQWLEHLEHPMGMLVRQARQFNDLAEKFIGTYIIGHLHRGRIHANIHQLRDSDGGARTQRLSYSDPPLHQMPARPTSPEQELLVKLVRDMFLPERGGWWAAPDYSGQEPRIMVHLAEISSMVGAHEIGDIYRANPDTDYHTMVAGIIGLPRKKAKDINQGLAYGMGLAKLARVLGVSEDEAQEMLDIYEVKLPYIGALTNHCDNLAKSRGWIKLLDGARCHFDKWQPVGTRAKREDEERSTVQGYENARRRWPEARLERAFTYRAANRAAQGGAARQMKRAMVAMHRERIPLLVQMHDEVGFTCTSAPQALLAREIMIHTTKLTVPVKVDLELGPTWGQAKHTLDEIFKEAA